MKTSASSVLSILMFAFTCSLLGYFVGRHHTPDTILHVDGVHMEIRVHEPVTTVIFDENSFGNMVISDRGEVTQ